ncbi:MAG: hypothetical protein WA140_12825 [Geobacteraceae bacterium]
MAAKFSDQDIEKLISESKPLPSEYWARLRLRDKRGHKEGELEVKGKSGSEFRLILRQSNSNPLDFSVILSYTPPKSNQSVRLRRYNGKSHEHTNQLEGNTFYDFHIHTATERYQDLGPREDTYAEPTDRYANFHGAIRCAITDCSFETPENPQQNLFKEIWP